ncbi:hypothetical protein VTL71DRAFT_12059 [Oculimacula yallundae]|uniref:Uncharacterized protein n=1 Tax=Oculimacula yallundae TaxID=86028 RepID=A0ABR4CRX5_9HELO
MVFWHASDLLLRGCNGGQHHLPNPSSRAAVRMEEMQGHLFRISSYLQLKFPPVPSPERACVLNLLDGPWAALRLLRQCSALQSSQVKSSLKRSNNTTPPIPTALRYRRLSQRLNLRVFSISIGYLFFASPILGMLQYFTPFIRIVG